MISKFKPSLIFRILPRNVFNSLNRKTLVHFLSSDISQIKSKTIDKDLLQSTTKKLGEKSQGIKTDACGIDENEDGDEEDDMEDMFVQGPAGMEWGGPTRGGRRPEPTRFGDWERNGRASDF